MLHKPFYDPEKSYEDNYEKGPFGAFADETIYQQKGDPKFDFLGQPVYLPFGIASGPLINGKFVKAALDKGFDIVEYKDTRTRKYKCHPLPNVIPVKIDGDLTLEKAQAGLIQDDTYREPIAVTNSFGIPSMDPDVWQPDLRDAALHAKKGQVVIGGLQGTLPESGGFEAYLEDFKLIMRLVKETGVKIIELNLSCPNEGAAHLLCFDVERSQKVVEAVKNEIGNIPLIIKIAYFAEDKHLKQLVEAVGKSVQAIAAINTIPSKVTKENGEQALPGEGRLVSGVCGHPIKWAGVHSVERLHRLREELHLSFNIVGVGGVTTPDDYFTYQEAGADTVMTATGAMWNPFLAQEIKEKVLKD